MSEALRQIFLGVGAVILAPADLLPRPHFRITLPPENANQAIGYDFSRVALDLQKSVGKVENANQLELKLARK